MLLLAPAYAYETDQLTDRAEPLADISEAANAELDRLLSLAADLTNQRTSCHANNRATKRVLAEAIYRVTTHDEYIRNRGELAGFGHGAYAAWLETSDLARREFPHGESIYGDLGEMEAFVLGAAGVCSTVRIGGVLMGTDKPDHFLGQGYEYWLVSGHGTHDARAVARGTRTENGAYGLLTSQAFSWADLYANWQGYQFYRSLLNKGSVLQRGVDGCVERVEDWSWADWLDDAADELVNPPYYMPTVGVAVRERLRRERDTICRGYEEWGPVAALRRQQIIARELPRASAKAPPRRDEWDLDAICTTGEPAPAGP